MNKIDKKEVIRTLKLFQGPDLKEVRLLDGKLNASGYFMDAAAIFGEEARLDAVDYKLPGAQYYFVLNQINPSCYGRKQHDRFRMGGTTTADADIIRRHWILVDADPERTSDVSATDEEKACGLRVIEEVREKLRAAGFAKPVFADSGNGYHLLYGCDLPNDDEAKELVRDLLFCLDGLRTVPGATVDTGVWNAARICKLYGTWARKGADTPEQPHRLAKLLEVPDEPQVTPRETIEAYVAMWRDIQSWIEAEAGTPRQRGRRQAKGRQAKGGRITDIGAWLDEHGIEHKQPVPYHGGLKYVLKECPFHMEHGGSAGGSAIFWRDGKLGFHCFHNHCQRRTLKEVVEKIAPGFYAKGATGTQPVPSQPGQEWTSQLERDEKGRLLKSPTNLELLMLNDELLTQVYYDSFTRHDVTDAEEFANVQGAIVNDESLEKLKKYIYEEYDLELSTDKIASALELTKRERARNPVEEYIRAEEWDGAPRVETLLIRYLGAEDSELNRAMTRKWMAAAVARALEPGIKFDHVLMLAGSQGIGKSTFFATIGGKWFSDSFNFAAGDKDKYEALTGAWILEIGELNGLKRVDAEAAKSFLTKTSDSFRPAYARKSETYPRHTVFAATTNEPNPLTGQDGNRRWWVVPVKGGVPVSRWLPELRQLTPQIWAEALTIYEAGEQLFLDEKLEKQIRERQENYNVVQEDDLRSQVINLLNTPLPPDFFAWSFPKRYQAMRDGFDSSPWLLRLRKYATAADVLNDLLGVPRSNGMTRRINAILDSLPDWHLIEEAYRTMPGSPAKKSRKGQRVKRLYIREGEVDDWHMFCSSDDDPDDL